MNKRELTSFRCERCGESVEPTEPGTGGICTVCKRVICRGCMDKSELLKNKKVVCCDCANSGR